LLASHRARRVFGNGEREHRFDERLEPECRPDLAQEARVSVTDVAEAELRARWDDGGVAGLGETRLLRLGQPGVLGPGRVSPLS